MVRRLASTYTFLSHSKRDWATVKVLIERLKDSNVWVDQFDLDLGDVLPQRIERGIQGAAAFILVLSKHSLASNWVQYESHMAVIRHLEDQNFRLLIIKIDDCEVPLRFRPFLFADSTKNPSAVSELVEIVSNLGTQETASRRLRRHFVNRAAEIGEIERFTNDPSKSMICVSGFFGIGKRTLAEEATRRIWQEARLSVVTLSQAHVGSRLAADLATAAGLEILPDGSDRDTIRRHMITAVELVLSRGEHLIFDHIETLLDDQGEPHDDVRLVLEHLGSLQASFRAPVIILSTRMPRLSLTLRLNTGFIRLNGLSSDHITTILESEAARLASDASLNRAALNQIAEHLHGYPLAGRLAAPMLTKYSPEFIKDNFIYIAGLRRDIAEAILAGVQLRDQDLLLLRILSMTTPAALNVVDLIAITGQSEENVISALDQLSDNNLIETAGSAVMLHPLVADFYWKQARSLPEFVTIASSIATRAKERLKTLASNDRTYVEWLALGCRMLFLADKPGEAVALRRDFVGELKVAAVELYQRQEYEQSLRYCEEYLKSDPEDFEIAYHRARSLSRLGQSQESIKALDELAGKHTSLFRRSRIHFGRARAHLEAREFGPAKDEFIAALIDQPKSLPALQGLAEVLMKTDQYEEAWPFVEKALEVSPLDSSALGNKAEILWRRGMRTEAIRTMQQVTRVQPNNATFLFRLGRFLHQSGVNDEARHYFELAKEADPSYIDVRLSLASVLIDDADLEEARLELDGVGNKGSIEKKAILAGIEAKYWIARGDLEQATVFAQEALHFRRSPTTLGTMAKIEATRFREAQLSGLLAVAEMHKRRATELAAEGLSQDPNNEALLHQRNQLS